VTKEICYHFIKGTNQKIFKGGFSRKSMEIITLKGNGQLRTGKTELDVPCLDKTLTFILPLIGPNYHENVMGEIDSQKLYRPTTAQTLSLVDLAMQNPKEKHCAEILNRFKNNYLWTATENLTFLEGVLVYDNTDGKMPQTSEELLKLYDAKDKRVRFVKPGFKTGVMPISEFLEHPYTIAQVGEDMFKTAERVAKVCHKKEAYVFGLYKANSDVKRLTAVNSGWRGSRLYLDGYFPGSCFPGGYGCGYASGVCK